MLRVLNACTNRSKEIWNGAFNGRRWKDACEDNNVLRRAHQDNIAHWSELVALLLRQECKKEIQFEKRAQTPHSCGCFQPGRCCFRGARAHLLSIKGKCCCFWVACGIETCLFERVLCLQTHRCRLSKASYFVPDSQTEHSFKKQTHTKKAAAVCKESPARRRAGKSQTCLSENPPSDTWFEIFPMIDLKIDSVMSCLYSHCIKLWNIVFKFQFCFVPYKFSKGYQIETDRSVTNARKANERDRRTMWKRSSSISHPRKIISSTCGNAHSLQPKFCFSTLYECLFFFLRWELFSFCDC